MEKRVLGRTEREVSVLGLGGHTYPVGDSGFCTHEERAELVGRLIDGGVNYFDTTWMNEVELLADSFRRSGKGAGSVVSLQYVDGISDRGWREKLRGEVERRLQVMGYSHAPLFLMGVGNGKPPLSEIVAAVAALSDLRDEGLIENIGVSCHELSRFDTLAEVIEETDLLDYMLIRYNYKFPQAADQLFTVAQKHDVGVVGMKVFCWDCGPDQWGRRISVFEPTDKVGMSADTNTDTAIAARESIRWVLQTPAISTIVPAMNAFWEVEQNLAAVSDLSTPADTAVFAPYRDRLWDTAALQDLSEHAESAAIRERANALLPR